MPWSSIRRSSISSSISSRRSRAGRTARRRCVCTSPKRAASSPSSAAQYDLIQVALLDPFGAAAAGLHALSESYLYTVEALGGYLERLAPDGLLAITRWVTLPPRDMLKLFATAATALERKGVAQPGRQACADPRLADGHAPRQERRLHRPGDRGAESVLPHAFLRPRLLPRHPTGRSEPLQRARPVLVPRRRDRVAGPGARSLSRSIQVRRRARPPTTGPSSFASSSGARCPSCWHSRSAADCLCWNGAIPC